MNILLCFSLAAVLLVSKASGRLAGEGIQGGDEADEGSYPYQVALMIFGKIACGGSILSEKYIITAAHCVVNEEGEFYGIPIKIMAGTINLNTRVRTTVLVNVERVFVPREYNPRNRFSRPTGDIAVLKLSEALDIESNKNLGKIELPEKDNTYAGVKAVISGFGLNKIDVIIDPRTGMPIEANGYNSEKMRYAETKVFTTAGCQRLYRDPISVRHICAAVVQRNYKKPEGICSGDSGGPLVYKNTLIGVVSTSPLGCREDRMPAVYTRVSSYLDFIENAVEGKVTKDMRSTTLKQLIWG